VSRLLRGRWRTIICGKPNCIRKIGRGGGSYAKLVISITNTDGHDFHSGCNACNAFAIISRGSDNTGNLCAVISV
jgi:hypothetical protein